MTSISNKSYSLRQKIIYAIFSFAWWLILIIIGIFSSICNVSFYFIFILALSINSEIHGTFLIFNNNLIQVCVINYYIGLT